MVIEFEGIEPEILGQVFIGDGAKVIGNVTLDVGANIWYNAVIRGDVNSIYIGRNSNIQDNCVVHVGEEFGVHLGDCVTVGHNATIHGCTIENNCLIGMNSVILDGAIIGEGSIVGAGSVVTSGTVIPKNSLVLGTPAKVVKEIDKIEENETHANNYVELFKKYLY